MSERIENDARRRLTEEELRERAIELSYPLDSTDFSAVKVVGYLGLRVGEEWFCVPLPAVREVLYRPRPSRVPFVPDFVTGLFNLRGEVMGLLNLATLFEIGADKAGTKTWNFAVLIRDGGTDVVAAGILADEVCEVVPSPGTPHDRIPSTIPQERAIFFHETFFFEETSFTVLNVENVISHPDLMSKT